MERKWRVTYRAESSQRICTKLVMALDRADVSRIFSRFFDLAIILGIELAE